MVMHALEVHKMAVGSVAAAVRFRDMLERKVSAMPLELSFEAVSNPPPPMGTGTRRHARAMLLLLQT